MVDGEGEEGRSKIERRGVEEGMVDREGRRREGGVEEGMVD